MAFVVLAQLFERSSQKHTIAADIADDKEAQSTEKLTGEQTAQTVGNAEEYDCHRCGDLADIEYFCQCMVHVY